MEYAKQTSSISAAVEQRPILDDLFDGAHSANERLNTAINRLRRLNDKIFGPRPEEAGKTGQPSSTGAATALREEIDALHHQLDKTDQLLSQLERFV